MPTQRGVQILDSLGRPMVSHGDGSRRLRTDASAYFGASNAREFYSWNVSRGSADTDLLPDLDTLRSRSRDLGRNHGVASGSIQTLVDNVVGVGPRLSAIPDYRMLGWTLEQAEEWSRVVEGWFREWWETTHCDAAGCLDGTGLCTQVFRGGMVNGEALVLPLWLPRSDSRWSTRLQVIEADRLSTPGAILDGQAIGTGGRIRAGIEADEYGRPLAYHIQRAHPGDTMLGMVGPSPEWERISAVTEWGRVRVIHVHDKERSGQSRGKPILAPVIGQFRMLDKYQQTELQAAVINAMVAAFLETPMDPAAMAEMLGADTTDERWKAWLQTQKEYMAPMKGAGMFQVAPGTHVETFAPTRPADQFGPFIEALSRQIGTAIGLPYELILKDFSKTNYSSARSAILEAFRFFSGRRKWLTSCFLRLVYELWLEEAISLGLVQAPNFYEMRFAYCRAKWIWPGRGWVDPVKEATAAQIRMDSSVSTLENECAEQGCDWEEIIEQRARELKRMRELETQYGISFRPPAAPKAVPEQIDSVDKEEETRP